MSDRISIVYDANVDDLKRKLDELIAKNKELSAYATAAAKALSNIASAQGLSTINNINNSFNTTVNVLAQVNTNLTQVNNQLNNTVNLGRQTSNTLNNVKVSADLLTRAFQFLAARMVAAFSINAIINFGNSIVEVERKMELLQNRINFVFDSANAGALAFARLRKMSLELGIEFSSLAEGFASFGIAAKMAGFSASETESVFTRVAVGLRAAGAGSLQTQRAFYALQQMLSKGVVAAEELRRQLGEALPGASDLMTQAYNRLHPGQELTNRQFTKMLEDGKIISKEILPEFSKVIEEVFAPALSGKQNSLDASIQRVTTQLERLKHSLSNFLPTKTLFNVLSDFFDDLNTMMEAGFFNFSKLAALAATGNLSVLTAELERLRGLREAEQIKAEKEETELQKRIEQRAQMYLKQGVTSEKAISGETDRIKEQREQLKGLIADLGKLEIAEKEARKASLTDQGLKQKEDAIKAVSAQRALIEEKKKEIDFTQRLISELSRLGQQREESEGPDGVEAEKNAIKAREEAMFRAKNIFEQSLISGDSLENQKKLMTDYIDAVAAYKILKDKAGAEESKNIRIQAEKEVALFALKIDLDLLKAKKANLEIEGKSITQINKDIAAKQAQIDVLGAQSQAESLREQAEANLAFREQELKEGLEIRTKDLTSFIATQQEKIDATKEGSKERLDLELSVLKAQESIEHEGVRFSLKSKEDKEIETNKIIAKYTKLRRQLTEKYNKDVEQEVQKSQDKIVDILQRANDLIERNEGDTFNRRIARTKQMFEKMARDIKDAMSKTQDFEVLGELTKALGEVEVAGKKATDSIELERASEIIGGVANVYSEIAKLQSTAYDNEEIALKRQLEQKLISEQEYERKAAELAKKRFEHEKKAATVSAIIDGALGVVKAIGKGRWWEVAAITAATGIQIATIQSQQFPGFKEGVIDLQGPGTATSDSIPARLSRGESVMTAEETTKYKPVLQAIRDNEFEAFVAKRYTDVMRKQSGNAGLGSSFAENVSNSFDMQTAELATLLKQNRRVAIKNVDEFAKAISRRSTTDKVINRRRFK